MATKMTAQQRAPLIARAKEMAAQNISQRVIAVELGVSQPTISGWLNKRTVQQLVAEKIRAELVCCDIYQRFQEEQAALGNVSLKSYTGGHDICFFGEWSAQIAESVQ